MSLFDSRPLQAQGEWGSGFNNIRLKTCIVEKITPGKKWHSKGQRHISRPVVLTIIVSIIR